MYQRVSSFPIDQFISQFFDRCHIEEAIDISDGFLILRPSGVAPLPYRVDTKPMTLKMQRNYNMRARSIDERDVWVRKLRQAATWSEHN